MSYNKNSEEYNFLYYSQLFVQINNLHNNILQSKQDDKLIFHINMCNNICITQLNKNKYMKELIKQINTDDHENESEQSEHEEEHEDEDEDEEHEDEEHEDELKVQINNITNLLGGEQELDINDFDPNSLNNFGNGLKSLLTPIQPPIQAPVQPPIQTPVQAPVQAPIQTPVQRIQRTKTIQRIVPIQSKTDINVQNIREQNEVPPPIIKNEIKEKYQNTNLIVKIKKKNE